MDKSTEQYMNGLRYGFGHARRYGQAALLRVVRAVNLRHVWDLHGAGFPALGEACFLNGSADYTAGVVDAALAMVQGVVS